MKVAKKYCHLLPPHESRLKAGAAGCRPENAYAEIACATEISSPDRLRWLTHHIGCKSGFLSEILQDL